MLKKFVACLLFCLAVLVSVHPGLAQDKSRSNDPIAQMQRAGWKIVQDGVMQRERGVGQVETFVFGSPGFVWKLQDLQSQLHNLRLAYQLDPSPALRKTILSHRQEIANTQKMIAIAAAAEAEGDNPIEKVTCSINFGYSATAGSLTTSQGVTGTASANFSTSCTGITSPFTGEVYAYSYSTASVAGAPTTQSLVDGPRTGANVTASAFTSQTGVPTCTSYAYASMTSSISSSAFSMAVTNTSCPAVVTNPVPHITGPSFVNALSGCTTSTWTASATGGTLPYTYSWTWNGSVVSTASSYARTTCSGGVATDITYTLGLTAIDSASRTGSTSLSVEIEKGGTTGGCVNIDGVTQCP
ncbi:MAG TPA: hypothetical protein VIE43_02090 [Thermoanaerobaculia bacterium]|jgi:hypothetical protein|nr:hypothetical protein [Thermoanaerobaculia bacterium]